MRPIKIIMDIPWDKKRTLKEYIFHSYYEGKRLSFIFNKVRKRYPDYFKSETELVKWVEENRPEFEK
jgi:hypothetical protein